MMLTFSCQICEGSETYRFGNGPTVEVAEKAAKPDVPLDEFWEEVNYQIVAEYQRQNTCCEKCAMEAIEIAEPAELDELLADVLRQW
jgi:hypothetical protein